jgi:hypothetical protein
VVGVLSVSIYVERLSVGGVALFFLASAFMGVVGIQDIGLDLVLDRTKIFDQYLLK